MGQKRRFGRVPTTSVLPLPAQPVDATQALNLSAGVSNCKVSRGRSFKPSDAYELAFAQHGGPRKMGFVRAVADTDLGKKLEKMVGRPMYRSMPDRDAMTAARK